MKNDEVMFKLSYGLFVISAKDGDRDNGCIINAVQQVTAEPNRITVTVNKSNFTHDMIVKTGIFNVSVLSEEVSVELIKRFGFQSGRNTDKMHDFTDYARSRNQIIYLTEGTNAYLSAEVTECVDLGSHTMFLAKVTDGAVCSSAESVTYKDYHKKIKPLLRNMRK